jgi:hypothetical protein
MRHGGRTSKQIGTACFTYVDGDQGRNLRAERHCVGGSELALVCIIHMHPTSLGPVCVLLETVI